MQSEHLLRPLCVARSSFKCTSQEIQEAVYLHWYLGGVMGHRGLHPLMSCEQRADGS